MRLRRRRRRYAISSVAASMLLTPSIIDAARRCFSPILPPLPRAESGLLRASAMMPVTTAACHMAFLPPVSPRLHYLLIFCDAFSAAALILLPATLCRTAISPCYNAPMLPPSILLLLLPYAAIDDAALMPYFDGAAMLPCRRFDAATCRCR